MSIMLIDYIIPCFFSLFILSEQVPVSKRSISNGPVITSNFPDPSLIQVDNTWYAFATNGGGLNIPTATSTDFENWQISNSDALPALGEWATTGATWAPDVVQLSDGSFVLYYTATTKAAPGRHCIGAATSKNIEGPYTPVADPLACQTSQGGAIDPAGFLDSDGSRYVVYKVDGNNIGHGGSCNNGVEPIVPTPIMLQQVDSDGITPIGNPTQILDRDDNDGPLVEAPSLVLHEGTYVLFFSSNCYSTSLYDVSYATSTNGVRGPYTKGQYPVAPLLVTGDDNGQLYGPGSLSVAPNGVNVVFHADQGTTSDTRQMWAGEISINGQKVTI